MDPMRDDATWEGLGGLTASSGMRDAWARGESAVVGKRDDADPYHLVTVCGDDPLLSGCLTHTTLKKGEEG